MKIGIELNYVIRDINSQMLKYYLKDIDKNFDDSNIEKNTTDFINQLGFKGKKAKENFLYIDYPYEIFGCANGVHRNSGVILNMWLEKLDNLGLKSSDVSIFSLKENALTIQSSYYFLSKIGCRVRNVFFPKDGKDMWDVCDVIITTNKRIVKNKPVNKKVFLIKTKDNKKISSMCDGVYDSFNDLVLDENFIKMLSFENKKMSWFKKIKNKFYKFF